jgi:hypothetical protein
MNHASTQLGMTNNTSHGQLTSLVRMAKKTGAEVLTLSRNAGIRRCLNKILATKYESSRTLNARLQPVLPKKTHRPNRS